MSTARKLSREDKRRRIIDAAVEVFAAKGFFGARVSEIAEAAGVADGTIYLYFKSKDDILISLFEEKMQDIIERLYSDARTSTKDDPVGEEYAGTSSSISSWSRTSLGSCRSSPSSCDRARDSSKSITPASFAGTSSSCRTSSRKGQRKGVFRRGPRPARVSSRTIWRGRRNFARVDPEAD